MPPLEMSNCHDVRQSQSKACDTQKKMQLMMMMMMMIQTVMKRGV